MLRLLRRDEAMGTAQYTALAWNTRPAREIPEEPRISWGSRPATALLTRHNKFLHKFAEALLINETMDADEVDIVYQGYLKERKLERILTQNRGLGATTSKSDTTTHEQTEDVQ